MKWYIVRDFNIIEQEDSGEDATHIFFECNCENKCDNHQHRVNKLYVGIIYFRTLEDAKNAIYGEVADDVY